MNFWLRCFTILAAFCSASSVLALSPGDRVDNFRLLDHAGQSHELYYLSDAAAIVLMTYGNGSAIVRKSLPRLREIRDQYRARGVEFLLIDSNLQDDRASVARESMEFGNDIPVLIDDSQLIGEALGVERTAEVFVIDPKTWRLKYHGPLDDRLSYGAEKPVHKHYLADALDALLSGKPAPVAENQPLGCIVDFPERGRTDAHARISYAERIAPLLIDKCVACHREGGVAPWAMTRYDVVKGFAPMIREVVRTKRMPPWHADPHTGVWDGDRSLSTEEKQTLVHWIEAGAPRGKGPDPLADLHKTWSEWAFGKPDMVIPVPEFDVPATGIVDYKRYVVPNTLGRDVWVRATDVIPGDRAVVHHVIVGVYDPQLPERQRMISMSSPSLGAYVPGNGPTLYPQDTGVLVRKDESFAFQVHYTSSGKATHD